jgi:hypothetical protein
MNNLEFPFLDDTSEYERGYEEGVDTAHKVWVEVAKTMGKSTYIGLMRRVEAEMKRRLQVMEDQHESK